MKYSLGTIPTWRVSDCFVSAFSQLLLWRRSARVGAAQADTQATRCCLNLDIRLTTPLRQRRRQPRLPTTPRSQVSHIFK
nr:unnamed protein product [Callosobruchus analis]